MLGIKRRLEGQETKNSIAGLSDAAYPTLPPRPYLRAHVLHRGQSTRLEALGESEVELRRIDTDEYRWSTRKQFPHETTSQADKTRQMTQDFGETHEREFIARGERFAPRFAHTRARHPDEACIGNTLSYRHDEGGTEVVAGSFSGDERDQRSLATLGDAQRMRLRFDRGKKSTKACSSG